MAGEEVAEEEVAGEEVAGEGPAGGAAAAGEVEEEAGVAEVAAGEAVGAAAGAAGEVEAGGSGITQLSALLCLLVAAGLLGQLQAMWALPSHCYGGSVGCIQGTAWVA